MKTLKPQNWLSSLQASFIKNISAEQTNSTQEMTIGEIRRIVSQCNDQQKVLNVDRFGPLRNDSVIIVVQVIIGFNKNNHANINSF